MSSGRLLVNGQPVQRRRFVKYELPGSDGQVVEARLRDSLRGIDLVVRGETYPLGPRVPLGLGILALAPLGLVAIGGALGGMIGAVGMVVSRNIAASERSVFARILLMMGVLLGAIALTLGLGGALHVALGN